MDHNLCLFVQLMIHPKLNTVWAILRLGGSGVVTVARGTYVFMHWAGFVHLCYYVRISMFLHEILVAVDLGFRSRTEGRVLINRVVGNKRISAPKSGLYKRTWALRLILVQISTWVPRWTILVTQLTKSSVEHTSADLSILHALVALDTHDISLVHSFLAGWEPSIHPFRPSFNYSPSDLPPYNIQYS